MFRGFGKEINYELKDIAGDREPNEIGKNYRKGFIRYRGRCLLLLLSLIVANFFVLTCTATNKDSVPSPQRDKSFGQRCAPGMCLIPQGFLLGPREKALSVHFTSDKNGWIVGRNGLNLVTTDGGNSWQRGTMPEKSFNDIFFVGKKGWAVGINGLILFTDDGGKCWKKQSSNTRAALMRLFFLDEHKGFSIGQDGTILRTINGGKSWEIIDLDLMSLLPIELIETGIVTINLYDIFFSDENSGWIVGDCGTILYSEDGGGEWDLVHTGNLPPLFSIAFKNDSEGWVVGQNGFSLKTDDGGKSWKNILIDKEKSLYRIRICDNSGVIVGDNATILVTNDGGKTWTKVETKLERPYPWLVDAWIISNSTKVLSVGKGIILETAIISKK